MIPWLKPRPKPAAPRTDMDRIDRFRDVFNAQCRDYSHLEDFRKDVACVIVNSYPENATDNLSTLKSLVDSYEAATLKAFSTVPVYTEDGHECLREWAEGDTPTECIMNFFKPLRAALD